MTKFRIAHVTRSATKVIEALLVAAVSGAVFFLFIYLQVDCQSFDIQRTEIPVQAFCDDGEVCVSKSTSALFRSFLKITHSCFTLIKKNHSGVFGGDVTAANAREKRSKFVSRSPGLISHRNAGNILRHLLSPLCMDLWSLRSGGPVHSSVSEVSAYLLLRF